jgi:hypothetical protein
VEAFARRMSRYSVMACKQCGGEFVGQSLGGLTEFDHCRAY